MKYCCFELTARAGIPNVVEPHSVEYTDEPVAGKHCVVMLDYPSVFHAEVVEDVDSEDGTLAVVLESNGDVALRGTFICGWENLPTYTFDPESQAFSTFDPSKETGIKRYFRRKQITTKLARDVRHDTELKHLRKVVKALVAMIPGAEDTPEVQEFLGLSSFIEGRIAEFPKDENDRFDVAKENGISPTRMKVLMRTGIDYGPTYGDLKLEDAAPDDGAEELKLRMKRHTLRMQVEDDLIEKYNQEAPT